MTRFVDAVACRWLSDAVRGVMREGYEAVDIEAAIEDHVRLPFADPRELPGWAEAARDERLSNDLARERREEKRRVEAEHDALVERERAARLAAGLPALTLATPTAHRNRAAR